MFMRILKKDLKRKKTMNIILLLFVIICSMFAAASLNNIIAVTDGIEGFFDKSGVPDVVVSMQPDEKIEAEIKALPSIKDVKTSESLTLLSTKDLMYKGKKMDNYINPPYLLSDKDMPIKYFDTDNNVVSSVNKGEFYTTSQLLTDLDAEIGDIFTLEVGSSKLDLKYMGQIKGALFFKETTSSPYILLNNEDFEYIKKEHELDNFKTKELYINTSDVDEIKDLGYSSLTIQTRENFKSIYLYDMLSAYIMLVISIVLMITAFVVLRFTIGFTINEEFREIGVMKAVGINNGSIRILYIVKYFAIAIVGSIIGLFSSLPLSKAMMKAVSKNMVLESGSNIIYGAISSAAVVIAILLFCYGCTRRVKKLSPIDAVRCGQTGERFKKKSLLHLGHSKLPATGYLSVNDVISAPKRFSIITLIFTLCMLLMTIMSVFALTLKSDKLAWLFNVPTSEAHIVDASYFSDIANSFQNIEPTIEKTEKMLSDNGMPGKCCMTVGTSYETEYNDKKATLWYFVTKGMKNDLFRCVEGDLPEKTDEIAMTGYAMKDLGVEIGDRIKTNMRGKEYEFIITGRFCTFLGGGHSIQLHPDFELEMNDSFSSAGIQIHFDDNPDKTTVKQYMKKIKEAIGSDKVYTTKELIGMFTQMSDTLNSIKKLMMILTVIITALIVILMERSFISKEKSEIALMKAVGISNRSIITQHAMRFVIVSVIACILSSAALLPVSNVLMSWICSMIGDVSDVKCDFNAPEVFALCPAILICITVIGSFLTALYTKTIKASDTASIE